VRGRRIGVAVLLVVGTLLWTAFGLGLWAQRQALDSDNWVDTSSELLEDEQIRNALALFLVDTLYQDADVQQRLEETLPPPIDRLAAPAAAGVKQLAERAAPRLLGSAAALNAWRDANRAAHDTLLAVVRGDVADRAVSLDLDEMLTQVAAGTGLPPDVVDKLPPDIANLQIARPDQLDSAKTGLDLLEEVPWVLFGLALLCFAGAIWLSPDRRRAVLSVGVCLIVAGIAVLALRRLAGKEVVDALADAPNASGVADDVWSIATSLMADAAQGSVLFGLFLVSGAWMAGPARWAAAVRRFAAPALREHAGPVRAGLGVLILLLVIWGPVPWTTKIIPILVFTAGAFLWLEWIRSRTLKEFTGDAAPREPTAPQEVASWTP
jgi:hypothetical protein